MNTSPSDFFKEFRVGASNFQIFKFPSLNSTNVFLKSNHSLYPDYAVIYTENQTSGRGRFDREWLSAPEKGLTFSMKLPLSDIPQENWCNITQLMALSVAFFLEELKIIPSIRWPNDILVSDAKICGILGELVQSGSSFHLILGTGLNVNECKEDFRNLDRAATSLFALTGKMAATSLILEKLLCNFAQLFELTIQSGFEAVVGKISERLYVSDSPVKVICGDIEYTGMVKGLTSQGRILLDTSDGTIEVLSGEITSRV
jgi:BirA family biotin operon repressor/biotin-[acetyl-CoA-carboxylase] ligase